MESKPSSTLTTFAKHTLMQQLQALSKHPPEFISVGLHNDMLNVWEVMVYGPTGSLYEGGFFKALLEFPTDFPNNPPKMRFLTEILHPNIYPDGKVCISILHPPGTDRFNEQESADERWRPILGVEQVLISVLSMLTDEKPNLDSPANLDAAKLFKTDFAKYKKEVRRLVRKSEENFGAEKFPLRKTNNNQLKKNKGAATMTITATEKMKEGNSISDAEAMGIFLLGTFVMLIMSFVLRNYIGKPLGAWFLNTDNNSKIEKFVQAFSECITYSAFLIYGFYIVPNQPYFPKSLDEYPFYAQWFPAGLHRSMLSHQNCIFYILYCARYMQAAIITLIEPKKKDFVQMMVHHIATILLVASSYFWNFVFIGSVIMFLFDFADPFLHIAKICTYKRETYREILHMHKGDQKDKRAKYLAIIWGLLADFWFGVFMIVFIISRNIAYPFTVHESMFGITQDHEGLGRSHWDVGVAYASSFYPTMLFEFVILILQFFWLRLILIGCYKVVVKCEASSDDRSDSEDEGEVNKKKKD